MELHKNKLQQKRTFGVSMKWPAMQRNKHEAVGGSAGKANG